MLRRWMPVWVAILAVACGDDGTVPQTAFPDASVFDAGGDAGAPASLRETGLWSDFAAETLAEGVAPYEPQFELWSDGATKRRWIYLPDGATIDTTSMDFWQLPVGTKVWKEFTRDGVRVETRLIERLAEDDWLYQTYQWNEDATDATLVGFQGVQNANGTDHDIPSDILCQDCHDRTPHRVLGFSAIQLDHEPTDEAMVNLQDLIDQNLLSAPPAAGSIPYFPVPGGAEARAALGYVHANCGNCHNETPNGVINGETRFWLSVTETDISATGLYEAIDKDTTKTITEYPSVNTFVVAGMPMASAVYVRMLQELRGTNRQMPIVGSELEDTAGGLAAVAAWITSL